MEEMRIEQNTISRDWTVRHQGHRFFVNFTESDGQTLALCNRENWDIQEETEDGIEQFDACVLSNSSPEEQEQADENAKVIDDLIVFCIRNWDNRFMRNLKKDLAEQRERLAR